MIKLGQSGYLTQRPTGTARDVFTWATKPAANDYTPWRVVRISDVGASFLNGNKGSDWYTDGTSWRPWTGSQLLYTLGDAIIAKTTNLTTPEILVSCPIPAGMLATVDHKIVMVASYNKSAATNTMTNSTYFGSTNTTADALILGAAQISTSRQGQTERFYCRVDATNLVMVYTGNNSYSTTTLAPQTPITVPNLDSTLNYLGFSMHLSVGSAETMNLTQFDVKIEA